MARAPALFFGLELPDTIAYKRTEAFVDFDFYFSIYSSRHVITSGVPAPLIYTAKVFLRARVA